MNLTKVGKCEVCEKEGPISIHYGDMAFCSPCWEIEEKASKEHMSEESQAKRLEELQKTNIEKLAEQTQRMKDSVQLKTDLFNAETQSIIELKKLIDSDDSIQNKPYQLGVQLKERFNHYKEVIFELNEKITEHGNRQKAIQVYLNQLANSLRAEEREKLRIQDINYKPEPPKKPRPIRKTAPKMNKAELKKWAADIGVTEYVLQATAIARNCSIPEAANILKAAMTNQGN